MIFTRVVLLPELPPDTGETNPLLKTIKVTNFSNRDFIIFRYLIIKQHPFFLKGLKVLFQKTLHLLRGKRNPLHHITDEWVILVFLVERGIFLFWEFSDLATFGFLQQYQRKILSNFNNKFLKKSTFSFLFSDKGLKSTVGNRTWYK